MKTNSKLLVASAAIALMCSTAQADYTDGLTNYWSLDNGLTATGSGGIQASVGTVNGTLVAPTGSNPSLGATGIIDQAVSLAGTDETFFSNLNMGTNNAATNVISAIDSSFTLSVWFKLDSVTGYRRIAGIANGSSAQQGFSISVNNDDIQIRGNTGLGGDSAKVGVGLNDKLSADIWHNVVVVFDQTNNVVIGYLDGLGSGTTQESVLGTALLNDWVSGAGGAASNTISGTGTSFGNPTANTLNFGGTSTSRSGMLGDLDEIGLWNRALSASEIGEMYTNQLNGTSIPEPSATATIVGLLALSLVGSRTYHRRSNAR
ncbi:LamG-like jellyroll fold domain-containing protein [Thalassobacterium sedimentorum]|nr:LamG-like jellyroll fold domain-containing protein [Coraliomargarita sp. SDUM461004]